MYEFYQFLRQRLTAIDGVAMVRVFNQQLKHERDDSFPLLYPLVLIEATEVKPTQRPGSRVTDVSLRLRLHVVHESISQGEDASVYDLVATIKSHLYLYTGGGLFRAFTLVEEYPDYEHDNRYTYKIEYATGFVEEIANPTPPESIAIEDFAVQVDLDIDSEALRTGDNKNYDFTNG